MAPDIEADIATPEVRTEREELLRRWSKFFDAAEKQDLSRLVAEKAAGLQHYDVLGMERVAGVLMWGRSGSVLLCSYLDGHDDVLTMPERCGERVYEFFALYSAWSLREKLLGFAAFESQYPQLFEGDFAISPTQYYAAVEAIVQSSGQWPAGFVESRRAFFLFLHIAYALALGRRTASSTPLIVFEQHAWSDRAARQLVEDFPQARFIHTIRDPISTCDAGFRLHLNYVYNHIFAPYSALAILVDGDQPHSGMEARTCTVRFEDLHCRHPETMRHLAAWLGIPFQPALLCSSFNGIPYVVKRDGVSWTGARPEQAQRRSSALSPKDRALLFAVFYDNFAAWEYPCPAIFGDVIVRILVFCAFCLFPMKMEWISARAVFRLRVLPAVRDGDNWIAVKSIGAIAHCRLKIIRLLGGILFKRSSARPALLSVLNAGQGQQRKQLVVGIEEQIARQAK